MSVLQLALSHALGPVSSASSSKDPQSFTGLVSSVTEEGPGEACGSMGSGLSVLKLSVSRRPLVFTGEGTGVEAEGVWSGEGEVSLFSSESLRKLSLQVNILSSLTVFFSGAL